LRNNKRETSGRTETNVRTLGRGRKGTFLLEVGRLGLAKLRRAKCENESFRRKRAALGLQEWGTSTSSIFCVRGVRRKSFSQENEEGGKKGDLVGCRGGAGPRRKKKEIVRALFWLGGGEVQNEKGTPGGLAALGRSVPLTRESNRAGGKTLSRNADHESKAATKKAGGRKD